MKRQVVAALGGTALCLLTAAPAGAAPPARNCPPAFDTYDEAALLQLATSVGAADPQAEVDEVLGKFDDNGDRTVCLRLNPPTGRPGANIIDDVAH